MKKIQSIEYKHYTTTQRDALTNLVNDTIIYNTTVSQYQLWNGTNWRNVYIEIAGANKQIQFNNNGVLGSDSLFVFDSINKYLGIGTSTPISKITLRSNLAEESATLGSEITDANNWTSTNWTGNYANGFTHTTGNTSALSRTMTTSNGQKYQISWVVTGRTAGSFTVTLGNVTSVNFTVTDRFAPTATANGNLIFTPTSDFNGTISAISVKLITAVSTPIYAFLDSTNTPTFEIRVSLNTLFNTFIGKNSGANNTTGYYNNAKGSHCLYNNTTGYNNCGCGVYSLYSNTTGFQNTSFGNFALYSNIAGTASTSIGYAALYNMTNSLSNCGFGYYAGRFQADGITALTTSIHSIYIGANCRGFNNSDNNSIVIGANAIGLGANTTMIGNSSTVTTAIYGKFGVGITAPTNKIHLDSGNATASYTQFTAGTTTGQTVNDGLIIGIDATGKAIINQQENLALSLYTNNTERFSIKSNGVLNIISISNYADNAAALAGGLVAGDLYRNGSNICIVI